MARAGPAGQVPVLVVLPASRQAGLNVLFRLQVTARSMLGALALNRGGMLAPLGENQGISVYPFLFTAESRPIARAGRRPVPFAELLGAHAEAERQVARLSPGSPLRVTITGSPGCEDSPG